MAGPIPLSSGRPSTAAGDPASAKDFDFSDFARADVAGVSSTRYLLAGVGAMFIVIGVVAIFVPISTYAISNWLVTICFLAIGAAGAVGGAIMKARPDLLRLTVLPSGLVLHSDRGPDETVNWTDPLVGITIWDYSEVSQLGPYERQSIFMRWKGDRGAKISVEALECVVASADAAGVPVLVREEVKYHRSAGRTTPEVTRIGRADRTPDWEGSQVAESA